MGEFLAGPVGSWLRVFGAAALSAYLGAQVLDADNFATNWKVYAVAGLVSVLPVVIAYLNPNDPRFGKTDTAPNP